MSKRVLPTLTHLQFLVLGVLRADEQPGRIVREALRRLESEGLIAIIPNRGPIVKELTADEVRELYAIRAVLEGLAARLFAENSDDVTLKTLGKAAAAVIAAYEAAEPARARAR